MKVIAQTAALQDALTLTGSIVATRTPKPVLQCVKLVAEGDVLTVLATDLEAGVRYQVTAVQVEEEGEALIPGTPGDFMILTRNTKRLSIYAEALAHPEVCGLAIGTRPDCVPDPGFVP